MQPNVVILTGGLSGSSVLAGLIARAGFWLGKDTKKIAYRTFENSQLVDLNKEILWESGYTWIDVANIPPPSIDEIQQVSKKMKLDRFNGFMEECNDHRSWLWKDPRLCYTIFFWEKLVEFEKCKFLVMNRDIRQTWTGVIMRSKNSMPFDKLKIFEENCIKHAHKFLTMRGLKYLNLTFEDLILDPNETIERINDFIGLHLNIGDLEVIYKGQLHRLRWSKTDYYKAKLKFFYYKYILRDVVQFPRKVNYLE